MTSLSSKFIGNSAQLRHWPFTAYMANTPQNKQNSKTTKETEGTDKCTMCAIIVTL